MAIISVYVSDLTLSLEFDSNQAPGSASLGTSNNYNDGVWHNIVTRRIVDKGVSAFSMWVDGKLVAAQNVTGVADVTGTAPLYAGAEPLSVSYPTYYLQGSIASVKIWSNKTISDDYIRQIAATDSEVCASGYGFNAQRTACVATPSTAPVSPPTAPPAPPSPPTTCKASKSTCSFPSDCCSQVCTPWTVPGTCLN